MTCHDSTFEEWLNQLDLAAKKIGFKLTAKEADASLPSWQSAMKAIYRFGLTPEDAVAQILKQKMEET